MAIGLSTYAFYWRWSDRAPRPLTLFDMLDQTHDLGVPVFQICDYPAIESFGRDELAELGQAATDVGITLERGTRGVGPDHLGRYLDLANALGASVVRSMLRTADHKPTTEEASTLLKQVVPAYEDAGVSIALETYEQVSTADLMAVVDGVDSPNLGVCLDPANSVARLELPADVVARTAPRVLNIHVKDFEFTRQAGWVGFTLVGCPLGQGLLDYDGMIAAVQPGPAVNQIVEHWLPWQDSFETTAAVEDQWTRHNIDTLRSTP